MKNFRSLLYALTAIGGVFGFSSCQDDFDDNTPVLDIPKATITANTTILELKQKYWLDDLNYVLKVEAKDDGEHYIVSGRVVSSDQAGNVYKKIVIEDGTAALAMSINANSLFNDYRIGQEIVIDVTDMYIGKYCGAQQLGWPDVYEKTGVEQTSFMAPEFFKAHAQLNGLPDPSTVEPLVVNKFSELPSAPEELPAYQSRLVRFNNVEFADGGEKAYTDGYKVNTSRIITDADGQRLVVRTSGYATFRDEMLPAGRGDVIAILDYYRTSDDSDSSPWQLILNSTDDVINFGNPTVEPGDKTNPYTVEQAIVLEADGAARRAWVSGYIVGAVAPEVTRVSSNSDIEWGAPTILANTLVFASTADCKDYTKCMVVSLPQDTPFREIGNLRDNPSNLGKRIWVYGVFEHYMGTWGVTGNTGATSQFEIEGVDAPGGEYPDGDGSETSPYNCAQVIAAGPTSTTESPAGYSGVWVRGYIVGSMPTGGSSTTLSGTNFSTVDAATTNFVIGPTPDCTDYTKCIGVQLPTSIRDALNLSANPGNLGRSVELYGDVMKYCGAPGLKNVSQYKLGDGGSTPDVPPTPSTGDGSQGNPYSCASVIAMNPTSTTTAVATGVWVEGYIVGSMPTGGSSTLISGTNFSTADAATTNIVIAPTADCTDYTLCISVQLPSESNAPGVRSSLNLSANPGNLGKKVLLYGDVMKYCGGPGLKNTSDFVLDGSSVPDTPDPDTPTGGGTKDDPYSCASVIALNPTSTSSSPDGGSGVWVRGFIVGTIPSTGQVIMSNTEFGIENANNTNLVLAPTADCTDYTKCIPVQLPTAMRDALSLVNVPGNLGKEILLYGDVMKYCGAPGLKNVSDYSFVN